MSDAPQVVLFHSPCGDGTCAAWALSKRWSDAEFVPASYGDPLPPEGVIRGKHVLIGDFSYPRDQLVELGKIAKSVTILDHHRSAEKDLADFIVPTLAPLSVLAEAEMNRQPVPGLPIQALFDQERSGAMLAWRYAFPSNNPPPLVRYVEDRDLWRWALPNSRETNAWIGSFPLTLEAYEEAHVALLNDRGGSIPFAGAAIERMNAKLIGEMLEHTARPMTIAGHEVMVANVWKSFASDAAGLLAEDAPFGATWFQRADGMLEFSLRNRGDDAVDVSEIAEQMGKKLGTVGGGHVRAAGFSAPLRYLDEGCFDHHEEVAEMIQGAQAVAEPVDSIPCGIVKAPQIEVPNDLPVAEDRPSAEAETGRDTQVAEEPVS